MAIRMQQRRGTAEQWTLANPVLATGEIGFETDTNKFKIGDGINNWATLDYFLDETALSGSLSDYVEIASLGVADGVATLDGSGKVPSTQLPDIGELSQDAVNQALTAGTGVTKTYDDAANTLTLAVDTNVIATKSYVDDEIAAIPAPDYTGLATETYVNNAVTNLVGSAPASLNTLGEIATALENDPNIVMSLRDQIYNTGVGSNYYADDAISAHNSDTTNVHGIADTSKLVATDSASTTLDGDLVVDGNLTVNGTEFIASATSITIEDNLVQIAHQNPVNTVDLGLVVGYNDGAAKHAGIVRDVSADKWKLFKGVTTEPATTVDFTQGSLDDLEIAALTASSATIGDVSNTELQYLNGVTSAIQTQLNGKAATSHTHAISDVTNLQTSLDAKAPLANPTFTGTVSGVTKAMVGLGNVDNTSDANKPISTATQNALNLKADLASPSFTGTVSLPQSTSIGDISATEIGYLNGVTSAIQTQLNTKANSTNPEFTVEITGLGDSISFPQTSGISYSSDDSPMREGGFLLFLDSPGSYTGGVTFSAGDVVKVAVDNPALPSVMDYTYTVAADYNSFNASNYSWTVLLDPVSPTAQSIADTNAAIAAWINAMPLTLTVYKYGTQSTLVNSEIAYLDGVTSNIQAQLDSKLESSDLTGYATETYVNTAVSNLVDSAPGTLDTLNELAAALGDDPNYATTITTALGNKQDKVSGVSDTEIGYLDGVTSAIQTQLNGKASTSHSHTLSNITDVTATATQVNYLGGAFPVTSSVQTQLDGKAALSHSHNANAITYTIEDKSANYTIVAADEGKVIRSTGAAITVTVADVFAIGEVVTFTQYGAGQITFAPAGGVTLHSVDSKRKTNKQYSTVQIMKTAASTYLLFGDIAA